MMSNGTRIDGLDSFPTKVMCYSQQPLTIGLLLTKNQRYSLVRQLIMAKSAGGLKGLIQMTGKSVYGASLVVRDYGTVVARWGYKYGGFAAFTVATTSMIVLMPLVFESIREVQVRCSARMYPSQPFRLYYPAEALCHGSWQDATYRANMSLIALRSFACYMYRCSKMKGCK
jgi:hypothetical protein